MITQEQLTFERDLNKMLNTISFQMGQMTAKLEDLHTCENSHLRYPWPLDQDCHGCRCRVEKFVERNHLEMAYRLFGWNAMVDHIIRDVNRMAARAEAWRNQGSGI